MVSLISHLICLILVFCVHLVHLGFFYFVSFLILYPRIDKLNIHASIIDLDILVSRWIQPLLQFNQFFYTKSEIAEYSREI